MSKVAYSVIDGVHRKTKKGYAVVDGVNRKLKKAYSIIGGVARPCWSGGGEKLVSYGTITSLSNAVRYPAGATVGGKALFAGGQTTGSGNSAYVSSVDVYSSQLSKSSAAALSRIKALMTGESIDGYAIFVGGWTYFPNNYYSYMQQAESYNSNLTKTTTSIANLMGTQTVFIGSASMKNSAYFAGGAHWGVYDESIMSSAAYTVNENLTWSALPALSVARQEAVGGSPGKYAVFAGGYTASGPVATADAYDENHTKVAVAALGVARNGCASMSVDGYFLVSGGYGTAYCSDVDVYDNNLTRTIITASIARVRPSGFSIGDCCGASGGYTPSGYCNVIDFYDSALTRTNDCTLSTAVQRHVNAVAGNYVLMAGGQSASNTYQSKVSAYLLSDE